MIHETCDTDDNIKGCFGEFEKKANLHFAVARVDDIHDAVKRQTRLRDVRGDDALPEPVWSPLEDFCLKCKGLELDQRSD